MKAKIFLIIMSLLNLVCCDSNKKERKNPKPKEHFNFIICSDLSNRLTLYNKNKTIQDTTLIGSFLDFYYPNIYEVPSRVSIGSKDKIQVLFYRDKNISDFNIATKTLNIDLSKFNDKDRIDYLKSKKGTYKQDKQIFKKEIGKLYTSVIKRPQGADTYNLFKSKVNSVIIDKEKYRNIMLIFTDGYIEYGSKQRVGNKTYYLNQKLVNEFRRKFKKRYKGQLLNKENLKQFFNKEKYGLVPVENEKLKNLEVLGLEFYERSETKNGNILRTPSDLEIITLFWEDWMRQSKVKRFKSYKVFGKEEYFENSIIDFIKSKSNYKLN